MITQIPNKVFCFTEKKSSSIDFISEISYFHTDYFFGFKKEDYQNFPVAVAVPEKAIIDSIGVVPVSVFEEAFADVNIKSMAKLLERIKKGSIIKRIGFLAERNGLDIYAHLKKFLNNRYVLLDPLAKKTGNKNSKWKVVENG
jgi:predicted transcriptional regulator of viral defense system